MNPSTELREFLENSGAVKVGFANLSELDDLPLKAGISIMVNIPKNIVNSIVDGPNIGYYNEYYNLNAKLNNLAVLGADFIKSKGYDAIPQTTDNVKEFGVYETKLPHKTVATRAGLGWIGKSALLVTKEFGTAIRLTSIITDMELDYGAPITESLCENCTLCTKHCPGNAISGRLWYKGIKREEFFDAIKCRKAARKLSKERMNKEITLCGKCIQICPYTQKYLNA